MSDLTKEEYMKALETVVEFSCLCPTYCEETFEEKKTNKIKFNSSMQSMKLLINEHFDNQLTVEDIDFLLLSEEERVNTYKNYEDIWKSCVRKLERQKEMLEE